MLGAPGIAARSKDARGSWHRYVLGARMLLGAPGIATRTKDARGSWHRC